MWVQFKVKWQDGLYKYDPGKVVELPNALAIGYCESGKAKLCKPPKWATTAQRKPKDDEYPSARRRIKKMQSDAKRQLSYEEIAQSVLEED